MPWGVPEGWVEPDTTTENRCAVSGVYASPGGGAGVGSVTFTPARGGIWRGEIVSADRVAAVVSADGRFTARLVPSEAVGRYTAMLGDTRLVIDVPVRSAVDLAAIIVSPETEGVSGG